MASRAPDPVHLAAVSNNDETVQVITPDGPDQKNPSVVKVTIAGCGGCGINISRAFNTDDNAARVFYYDTSMTNTRSGEKVWVIGDGSGSGSHRQENARDIEQHIVKFSNDEMGAGDVAIVIFSLAGGSGSVIGPLMAREYYRRLGMRVVCVCVVDTTSTTGAKNTINTLKTLDNIAKNADLYLPLVVVSNDTQRDRRGADEAARAIITDLVEILTKQVHEVDRNDRLNFINPAKVVDAKPGLKMLRTFSDIAPTDSSIVIGLDSEEIVDSLLIVQNPNEEAFTGTRLPMSRLKKVGFYYNAQRPIAGRVTGDISQIDKIIDAVEHVQQMDKSSRYGSIDRLGSRGDDDLVL